MEKWAYPLLECSEKYTFHAPSLPTSRQVLATSQIIHERSHSISSEQPIGGGWLNRLVVGFGRIDPVREPLQHR